MSAACIAPCTCIISGLKLFVCKVQQAENESFSVSNPLLLTRHEQILLKLSISLLKGLVNMQDYVEPSTVHAAAPACSSAEATDVSVPQETVTVHDSPKKKQKGKGKAAKRGKGPAAPPGEQPASAASAAAGESCIKGSNLHCACQLWLILTQQICFWTVSVSHACELSAQWALHRQVIASVKCLWMHRCSGCKAGCMTWSVVFRRPSSTFKQGRHALPFVCIQK